MTEETTETTAETPAQKAARFVELSAARWNKPEWQNKKTRTRFARYVSSHKKVHAGGRPPSPDRCPCGIFTRKRAAQRNHRCTAKDRKA
jgi:hypothetical protein